jgi:hypothetical protein
VPENIFGFEWGRVKTSVFFILQHSFTIVIKNIRVVDLSDCGEGTFLSGKTKFREFQMNVSVTANSGRKRRVSVEAPTEVVLECFLKDFGRQHQGCQIFLRTTYQNEKNIPNDQTTNGQKITNWP